MTQPAPPIADPSPGPARRSSPGRDLRRSAAVSPPRPCSVGAFGGRGDRTRVGARRPGRRVDCLPSAIDRSLGTAWGTWTTDPTRRFQTTTDAPSPARPSTRTCSRRCTRSSREPRDSTAPPVPGPQGPALRRRSSPHHSPAVARRLRGPPTHAADRRHPGRGHGRPLPPLAWHRAPRCVALATRALRHRTSWLVAARPADACAACARDHNVRIEGDIHEPALRRTRTRGQPHAAAPSCGGPARPRPQATRRQSIRSNRSSSATAPTKVPTPRSSTSRSTSTSPSRCSCRGPTPAT